MNLTSGGQDYWFHTEETKKIMSEKQKGNTKTLGRKQSKEEIEKRVSKLKGQKRTPEQRKRMSDAAKGRKATKETIDKMKISFKYKNSKKVIDKSTGKIYGRVQDAADDFNMNKSTLTAKLNGKNKNNTTLEYL